MWGNIIHWKAFKVGGITFMQLGRLQLSFCVVRKCPWEQGLLNEVRCDLPLQPLGIDWSHATIADEHYTQLMANDVADEVFGEYSQV